MTRSTHTIQTMDTADGPFTILTDERGRVLASGWTASHTEIVARLGIARRPASMVVGVTDAAAVVDAYYAGDLAAIDEVEVAQSGTEMQLAGWKALRGVEPGHPLSYAEFATLLGKPAAVRAAAAVCARNAPALFVPCHRVLRSDGSLGGFAWGLEVKASLLARESVDPPSPV